MARKTKKVFSRRARTGIAAAPTSSFMHFNDYIRLEVDKKEISSTIKQYFKTSLSKEDYKIAIAAPEWAFTSATGLAATIAWKNLNFEFPAKWNAENVLSRVNEFLKLGLAKINSDSADKPIVPRKSIQELLAEKRSNFIGGIEEVLDDWENNQNYSLYNEMKKADIAASIAKAVYEYYLPIRNEADELVNQKTPDLLEAFSYMSVKQRKAYLAFLNNLLDDAEKYLGSKKATRKTRKPQVKSALKQIEKLKYQKENREYKLTSINPSLIIGAMRVYLFNTKNRHLTELISDKPTGFEVSGSTIKGLDVEACRYTTLRKPEEFVKIVLSKTPNQIDKEWAKLTTKTGLANGRMNDQTIILRALEK